MQVIFLLRFFKPNKAIKQENLQLAVFTAFNILASYKFPLIEALAVQGVTLSIFKQSSLFTSFLIVFGFAFRYYAVYKSDVDINILGVALSVIVAGLIGGVGFYFGQLKIQETLPVKYLAFSALFVFFMSHNLSNLLGLYQLSWFAYLAVVCSLAFVTALRVPKMLNKEKYS